MDDTGDLPGENWSVSGGESDTLARRPDPEPRTGGVSIPGECQYPGCTTPAEPGGEYCKNPTHTDYGVPNLSPPEERELTRPAGATDLIPNRQRESEDSVDALRRDVARLEGKVDALLEDLEVTDGDE
ncbi:hypothetical protein [Haloplanus sp. C73]|uniref:hypothetical protein n=1 Tax=Haloplanus sp. C73 TaxID=3421641 RepID=UPI003EB93878